MLYPVECQMEEIQTKCQMEEIQTKPHELTSAKQTTGEQETIGLTRPERQAANRAMKRIHEQLRDN